MVRALALLLLALPAAADPVPLDRAGAAVRELGRRLRKRRAAAAELVGLVREVEHAYLHVDAPEAARAGLRKDAERRLLKALVYPKPGHFEVRLETARALGRTSPGVAKRFRTALERVFDDDAYETLPVFYDTRGAARALPRRDATRARAGLRAGRARPARDGRDAAAALREARKTVISYRPRIRGPSR